MTQSCEPRNRSFPLFSISDDIASFAKIGMTLFNQLEELFWSDRLRTAGTEKEQNENEPIENPNLHGVPPLGFEC